MLLSVHTLLVAFALAWSMRRDSVAIYQVQHQRGPEHQLKKVGDKTAFDQRNFLTMAVDYLLGPLAALRSASKKPVLEQVW